MSIENITEITDIRDVREEVASLGLDTAKDKLNILRAIVDPETKIKEEGRHTILEEFMELTDDEKFILFKDVLARPEEEVGHKYDKENYESLKKYLLHVLKDRNEIYVLTASEIERAIEETVQLCSMCKEHGVQI